MSSYIFDQVKNFAVTQDLNFNSAPNGYYRIVLCTFKALEESNSSNTLWSQMKHLEIILDDTYNDTGYPRGTDTPSMGMGPGSPLNDVGISTITDAGGSCDDGLPDTMVYSSDVVYDVSTIDADCGIIMRESSTFAGDYDLITALDLRGGGTDPVRSNNGVFQLLLSSGSGGFLIIK